jgi:HlyD family secretion protein
MMQVLQNRRTRQFVKVGDELYQGQRFASVPDLSKMKVKSTVNEADIAKIHLKQKVVVRLDAFPSIPFEGEIIEMSRLSRKENEKSRTKVFDIVILLYKSDPILKPGMTVRCEIFTAQLDDVYYVENECIIRENLRYYLMIEDDGDFKKREVKIGPRNYQYTVIYGEYSVGQRVLPLQEIGENDLSKSDMN